ncbi:unnamed protein product [Periconia digitata]|uniref:Uncharacterized protein n=1 Tax=Periconia digitata TaxID=1303443 RepID=A0A9W4UU73_9PLEO|nr:unnamed protein product [Periconia digitata]
MAIFSSSMAPKKTPTVQPVTDDASSSHMDAVEPKRPGTSGTEMLLKTNRRDASAQFLAAQRAENAYKAKKRAATARELRTEARTHFRQSAHHLKEGVKSIINMVKAVPWMIRERKERRQAESEKKSYEKSMEKKKKLEEMIARQEAQNAKEKLDASTAEA